jgi:hypothetical protein
MVVSRWLVVAGRVLGGSWEAAGGVRGPDEALAVQGERDRLCPRCGAASIMGQRCGTIRGTAALRELIEDGAREAWRLASVGVLIKVADHSHQGELLLLSDWIKSALGAHPYIVLHAIRPGYLRKHRVERVPRNNGATWLAFRKDGHRHRDFDRLYARQEARARKGAA